MSLNRTSLKEQALQAIRQAMVSGEIRQGQIQSASALAERLGTSTGPIREAMLTLVEQGIMEVVPNRGFRAIPLTDHDLDEVYDLRLMLEVPAMRRLSLERSPDGASLEEIRDHAVRCRRAAANDDVIGFLSADRDFHLALTKRLGNARLVKVVAQLRDQTRLYGLRGLAAEHRLSEAANEHFELLDAVEASDADRAERVMTQHLAHVRSDWAVEMPTTPQPSSSDPATTARR